MDPNEALRVIREQVASWINLETPEDYEAAFTELAAQVSALDEWLSKGGFLPEAWQR